MRFFRLLFLNVIFVLIISCKEIIAEQNDYNFKDDLTTTTTTFDFLPSSTTQAIYTHETFSLSYSEEHEQAEWVAYFLEKDDIHGGNYKRPFFQIDEHILTGSAHWKNYKNSGYNKGHLLPAGDRKATYKEYQETFLTSNIAPQKNTFNEGVWNRLEQKVRYWAVKYDGLYVVTAGVLTDDLKTIGFENVSVPKYFYKILLSKDRKRMIAFLVPHENSDKPLYDFVVSVDTVENLTGIDFFPNLDDAIEEKLEASSSYKEWSF